MTRQVALRRPLLTPNKSFSVGEVAGGTTAECAAVCCCFPFALIDLLFLTIYKIPAAAFRRAFKRRSKKVPARRLPVKPDVEDLSSVKSFQRDKDVMRVEKEMWDQFARTGFWRSPSQKDLI